MDVERDDGIAYLKEFDHHTENVPIKVFEQFGDNFKMTV